jgi:hypothetical protein
VVIFLLVEMRVPMARPHLICLAVCPEGPAPVAAGTHTEIAESHQPLLAPRIVMEGGGGPQVVRGREGAAPKARRRGPPILQLTCQSVIIGGGFPREGLNNFTLKNLQRLLCNV